MWRDKGIIFTPDSNGFDNISVKDPSIVYHNNLFHLCYTAIGYKHGKLNVACGLAQAKSVAELNTAHRLEFGKNLWPDYNGTFVAPQLFRFDEREKWYLIAQTQNIGRQPRYQPVFSENHDITDPQDWSTPKLMVNLESLCQINSAIDFWVIRQDEKFWLFFSDQQANVWALWTTSDEFPHNFREPQIVLTDRSEQWELHEAAHIYYAGNINKYLMIVEYKRYGTWKDYLNRFIRAFVADNLPGPWQAIDKPEQFFGQRERIISSDSLNQVSHPEFIRTNHRERMEITSPSQLLIQETIEEKPYENDYIQLKWHLRLIEKIENGVYPDS